MLEQWKLHQEDLALAEACAVVDEWELGWDSEWQTLAISDMEASQQMQAIFRHYLVL